jgi:hypothetical protein
MTTDRYVSTMMACRFSVWEDVNEKFLSFQNEPGFGGKNIRW